MNSLPFRPGPEHALHLDALDQLAPIRDRFVISDPDMIYLDGNSLGRLPRATIQRARELVEVEWGTDLVRGWQSGWYDASRKVGDAIARLVGAQPGEIVVADSTSVNLFKLVIAALQLRPDRSRIVTDGMNFPSDLYILQGCARLLGNRHQIHAVPSEDGIVTDTDKLSESISRETALVTLSQIAFKSGFLYDVPEVTARARAMGAVTLWDLSHSVGVVPIHLDRWNVDMAVGCTYKYLNGGPGAPAFLFVRRDLQESAISPIWGWFGQRSPFAFDLDYRPAPGMSRFLAGTPPILSLLALEPALSIVEEAGVHQIREKSVALTSYLIHLFDLLLSPLGFSLGTPRNPERRGSHVSLLHPDGYRISQALIREMNVLPDFREPDNIRYGLSPLYTTFSDVWHAVDRTRSVVEQQRHAHYSRGRQVVT